METYYHSENFQQFNREQEKTTNNYAIETLKILKKKRSTGSH